MSQLSFVPLSQLISVLRHAVHSIRGAAHLPDTACMNNASLPLLPCTGAPFSGRCPRVSLPICCDSCRCLSLLPSPPAAAATACYRPQPAAARSAVRRRAISALLLPPPSPGPAVTQPAGLPRRLAAAAKAAAEPDCSHTGEAHPPPPTPTLPAHRRHSSRLSARRPI